MSCSRVAKSASSVHECQASGQSDQDAIRARLAPIAMSFVRKWWSLQGSRILCGTQCTAQYADHPLADTRIPAAAYGHAGKM
eukprot:357426-Chlamydomonas_euryale.AAC.3